jgi:DNA-binding NarL/FixJ family response regulator
MSTLRILIADDHTLVRKGLRALLEAQDDLELIGEATNADEAVSLTNELLPDVVLMDLHMPGGGIEATKQIMQTSPSVRVLVVTMFKDDDSVFTALRAGARGYILKDADEDEMLRAVRAVGEGEAIFSPEIATRVLNYFAKPRPTLAPDVFPELTAREREILEHLTQNKSNSEIARNLNLSLKTVSNYVSNIFSKLQVADRAEAIARAQAVGLGAKNKE